MLAERRRKGIRVTDGEMQAVLALVRRAATVDPENPGAAEAAFDALLTPEIPLLYRFIRARVSSDQVAEDLLQETMLGAWRQLGNFDGRSRFGTWLLAIAKYRVIDWQRRESRQRPRQAGSFDDSETGLSDTLAAPETDGDPVTRLDLGRRLMELGPEDRLLLQLVFDLGLDYQAAGRVLDIPVGTVKSRMYRLRRQLRAGLADEETGWEKKERRAGT